MNGKVTLSADKIILANLANQDNIVATDKGVLNLRGSIVGGSLPNGEDGYEPDKDGNITKYNFTEDNAVTPNLKAQNGASLNIEGVKDAPIKLDITVGGAQDRTAGSSAIVKTNGGHFTGNVNLAGSQAQSNVWINGGSWTGDATIGQDATGMNVTVEDNGNWTGKAATGVRLHLNNGTFINKDNSPNGKVGIVSGSGTIELAPIAVPTGGQEADSTTLELTSLATDANVNFVGRSGYGKAGAKEDKLSVLHVTADNKDVTTPSNSTLTIVAPLERVYKQYETDSKDNTKARLFTFTSNTDNPLFSLDKIGLSEEGFTVPVLTVEKDAQAEHHFDVIMVGKKTSPIFEAIRANAVGIYDRAIASRVLVDRALHRNELINKAEGPWARYKYLKTGANTTFTTSGNAIELGINHLQKNAQTGYTVEYGKDNVDYQAPLSGSGNLKTRTIGIYHTQFLKDHAYVDYAAKIGRMDAEITVVGSNANYDHKFSTPVLTTAVEYGKEIKSSDAFTYIPQVQMQYGRLGSTSFTNSIGKVKLGTLNSVIMRLGVDANYAATDYLTYVGSANIMHEFAGKQTVSALGQSAYDAVNDNISQCGTWYALGLGVQYKATAFSAYAHVDKVFGDKAKKDTQVTVGVKYAF